MAQWSAAEDEQLRKLVNEYGPKRWSVIAAKLKTKGSKQCRRRWKNHLNADLKSGGWTPEEDRILLDGHRLHGNKWTEIAKMVGGRTDNAVKNRYAALCKRDSRGIQRATTAGRGRGRGRKQRHSDSDGEGSDEDPEEDSEAYEADDTKRSSSPSTEDREASPVRVSKGHGSSCNVESNESSPPDDAAASAVAGSSAGRSSVLGRRRRPAMGFSPLQSEPEAAAAPKRRAVSGAGLQGRAGGSVGCGVDKQLLSTPDTQHPKSRPLEQLPDEGPAPRSPQPPLASDSSDESEGLLVAAGPAYGTEQQRRPDVAETSGGASGGGAAPKKLPLTINIPNAASAEPSAQPPPTTSAPTYGIEIRVLKGLLSPCEIQYTRELNEMQLPLHINLDDDASMFRASAGGRGAPSTAEPPLTTSRQAAQNALAALASPASSSDFNDVLKWFQTGLTPRSTCGEDTPRLIGRLGFTPHGLSGPSGLCAPSSSVRAGRDGEDVAAGMLGTGLTPRCLLADNSPLVHSAAMATPSTSLLETLAATPSRRIRRQIAVAAAVAAAASAGPGPCSGPDGGGQPDSQLQSLGSLGAAAAGFASLGSAGVGTPGGLEMHAGHRQLLTKLIQTAARIDSAAPCDAGGGEAGARDSTVGPAGRRLMVVPPSPGRDDGEPSQAKAAVESNNPSHSCGVVVTPHFTQQELMMLLEVLTSDDNLQALPPPPVGS